MLGYADLRLPRGDYIVVVRQTPAGELLVGICYNPCIDDLLAHVDDVLNDAEFLDSLADPEEFISDLQSLRQDLQQKIETHGGRATEAELDEIADDFNRQLRELSEAHGVVDISFRSFDGDHLDEFAELGFDASRGFETFEDFKAAYGDAGPGQAWHHIVEQTRNAGRFPAEILHNPDNLVRLPHGSGTIHNKISAYYSSIQPFSRPYRVREWITTKSFKEQFEFGVQTIKDFGGAHLLPPRLRD